MQACWKEEGVKRQVEDSGTDPSLSALRRNQASRHLALEPVASRTVTQHVSVV